jgi:uncharacterized Zn finger protein
MAEPKCPDCGVVGLKKVVSTESAKQSKDDDAWFEIVLCEDCGHVYGVFAKHISSHEWKASSINLPKV